MIGRGIGSDRERGGVRPMILFISFTVGLCVVSGE